jgi:hypothetical protein
MKLTSRVSRLAVAIVAHLHERELLRAERKVLDVLKGGVAASARVVMDADIANQTRLAQLERRLPNRVAIAARALVKRMPTPVRKAFNGAGRLVLERLGGPAQPARERKAATPPPAPAANPYAAVVPFGRAFPPPRLQAAIGVVAHMFYPELAAEMRGYLEHLPGAADVYLSTDVEAKRQPILSAFAGWSKGVVQVRLAPNRGRDVAPKLIAFKDVYDRHPYVLHLHGKRSPHDSGLRLWRYFIYETLIGSPAVAASILSAFDHAPSLGMIAPQHYHLVRNAIGWGDNLSFGQDLARRMGFELDPAAPLDFPSGSMFWARSAALRPLLDLGLTPDDFPPEQAQHDGTMAHAIERLYFLSCERAGLQWIHVERQPMAYEPTAPPSPIEDLDGLQDHLRRRTVRLLPDHAAEAG